MVKDKRADILKRANKFFRQARIDAAIKEYEQLLAIKPDDLEIRHLVGDLHLKQNNTSEAVRQFEWLAGYYLNERLFAKAIVMFKRIAHVAPNNEDALLKLADLYTKQGLVIEAKQIYLDMAEECKRQGNRKKNLGMYKKILEFDRQNIKMRTLLADNYLEEGMVENAVEEYAIAADILLNKKKFRRAEELLLTVLQKSKDPRLIEKLLYCYTAQNDYEKAIELLNGMGEELFQHVHLLKALGELYLKKNMVAEAEKVFIRISELVPGETEVIMRLGKVYLHREEYDKTYELFLPVVDKNIKSNKFEEAASLLRFIIASNNSYLPALTKQASLFKLSGKTNNLIALYESLIPVYERKGMKDQLRKILEELIHLSDTPFTYEEQLEKLTGHVQEEKEEEDQEERESEFVSFNLRVVDDALQVNDGEKAVNILIKAKTTFPRNLAVRQKLFEVYESVNRTEDAVKEGKGLLDIYNGQDMRDEYTELFDKLSHLKSEDDKLAEISGDEKTSIDIDFHKDELAEEISDFDASDMHDEFQLEESGGSDELMVLSEDQSLPPGAVPAGDEYSKSLSTYLSELDFYINDRYLSDAEKLLSGLQQKFPGNDELSERLEILKKTKAAEAEASSGDQFPPMQLDYEYPGDGLNLGEPDLEPQEPVKVRQEGFSDLEDVDFDIEVEEPLGAEELPALEIDKEELIQSPSPDPSEESDDALPSLDLDDLDLDSIIMQDSSAPSEETGLPFQKIGGSELGYDSDEDLLKGEELFIEEAYFETEKNVDGELKSIKGFKPAMRGLATSSKQDGNDDEDQVICTVFSPPAVRPASDILIQVFAHLYSKIKEAEQMAKEFDEDTKRRGTRSLSTKIKHGTRLTFELIMKGVSIDEPIREMAWMGRTESVSFDVEIFAGFKKKSIIGKVIISQDTIPIGMINFKIKVRETEESAKPMPIGEAKNYRYAFISYASEDRTEVLRRVQMLSLLKIEFFQDIFNLNPGDRWENKLYQKIDEADVFFLFWSNAARNSEWVKKEISYAIQRKQGIDENPPEIIPVIIEGPPVPLPPQELRHIHFNDKLVYFMDN